MWVPTGIRNHDQKDVMTQYHHANFQRFPEFYISSLLTRTQTHEFVIAQWHLLLAFYVFPQFSLVRLSHLATYA